MTVELRPRQFEPGQRVVIRRNDGGLSWARYHIPSFGFHYVDRERDGARVAVERVIDPASLAPYVVVDGAMISAGDA